MDAHLLPKHGGSGNPTTVPPKVPGYVPRTAAFTTVQRVCLIPSCNCRRSQNHASMQSCIRIEQRRMRNAIFPQTLKEVSAANVVKPDADRAATRHPRP
jgi:hypothetical protein